MKTLVTTSPDTALPSVYDYMDYRKFLSERTAHLKRLKKFNLRDFARKAGIRSPGFLKMVVDGRRNVTEETAAKFCVALGISGKESEYFVTLTRYNQTDNPDEKRSCFEKINKLRPRSEHFVAEKKHNRYFSRHHYVCIREMVALKDFREDYEWIGERCFPHVSATQAKEAVKTLLELGLLRRDAEGRLEQVENFIRTQDRQSQEIEAYHFHEGVIDKARHALGQIPPEKRNYYALTLPMSKSQFEEVIADFYAFRDRVVEKIEKGPRDFDEVYQVNFQLFPVTKKSDPKKKAG